MFTTCDPADERLVDRDVEADTVVSPGVVMVCAVPLGLRRLSAIEPLVYELPESVPDTVVDTGLSAVEPLKYERLETDTNAGLSAVESLE